MIFDRQIFYFHEYNGSVKEKNVGFLKWTYTDSGCKMEIYIKGLTGNDTIGFYTEKNEYLGEVFLQNGRGELSVTGAGTIVNGIDFTKINNICGEQQNGKNIICVIREEADFVQEEKTEEPQELTLEEQPEETVEESSVELREDIFEDISSEMDSIPDYYETAWDKMCRQYENMNPFSHEEICLKITPADFYLFRDSYDELSRNSFLLHGYYNYKYLILRKQKEKEDAYYLGVPGIYHEREIMAAKMFGFEGFEGEDEEYSQGSFGYYMISVK